MLFEENKAERPDAPGTDDLIRETSGHAADLHAIAFVAARLFNMPIALVTLLDASTVWIRGSYGVNAIQATRRDAFCDQTAQMSAGETFVVVDAHEDPKFSSSILVTGEPHARFYAGVPITLKGQVVGTLCIMDRVARRDFGPLQVQDLQKLAIVVESQLGLYLSRVVREAEVRERGRVEALLGEREAEVRNISKAQSRAETVGSFGHWYVDLTRWTISWSDGIARIFDRLALPSLVLDLDTYFGFFHPDDMQRVRRRVLDARAGDIADDVYRGQARIIRPSGEIRTVVVDGVVERDHANNVIALQGVLMDTTELACSEEQARATSELLRTTLESIDQGLLMLGPDERVRIHNRRARELMNLPKDLLFDGASFETIRKHQIETGEFDCVSDTLRQAILRDDLRSGPVTHERTRPDGTVLDVRAVLLADGSQVRTYTDITQRRSIEHAVQDSEQRFRQLAEATKDVIIRSDLDATRRYVSPAARTVLGYEPEELVGAKPAEIIHPDDVGRVGQLLEDLALSRIHHATSRHRLRRKDGSWIWVEVSFSLTRDIGGTPTGYVAAIRDISDRKAVEDALRFSEERLALALDSGSDGLFDFDTALGEIQLSGPWLSLLGYEEGDIKPTLAAWNALTHPDDLQRCKMAVIRHFKGLTPKFECEYRFRKKSGDYVWTLARGKVVSRNSQGRALRMVGTHVDITGRKTAEQLIEHLAHHDALTGLPNRTRFRERLDQEFACSRQNGGSFCVLACDLDGFKAVNDTLGHSAGDQLLRIVAERLKSVTRAGDTVARLGGDEFAIIVGALENDKGACSSAQQMIEAVQKPIQIEGQVVSIGISVGIAVGPNDGSTAEHLFRNADIALYQAKAEGRNTYRFFKAGMDAEAAERNRLVNDLREAVRNNRFTLHYQPILTIATGTVTGFEALLRWHHPSRGEVSPSDFIAVAEQTGLIVALGDWVLLEACRTAASWPDRVRVAVNMSTVQFHRPEELKRSVTHALSTSGLDADRLELEITESVLVHDAEAVIACLHGLREMGVRIALDDFGTGFSSLNYLRRFPFSKIKIDKSFVREIADPDTVAIVRAVVGLATRVQADITAEGVETMDQLARVNREGCTEAQGFLFSRPLPAIEAADLLNKRLPQIAA